MARVYLHKQDDETMLRDVPLVRLPEGQPRLESLLGDSEDG
ncbi:MAG: hypothetical protein JW753_04985 [Dehalococcoidia bacterium]|nr:hypothetical protein [Dehalococcoidia bacterium]